MHHDSNTTGAARSPWTAPVLVALTSPGRAEAGRDTTFVETAYDVFMAPAS